MGRNYVMSDIHGMSDLLKKILDMIQPGADDRVYILGDMIDRGAGSGGGAGSGDELPEYYGFAGES